MRDDHLKECCRQGVGKFIHPGYQEHQLCMLSVVFLQVPTPKNNPIHDRKTYLAAAQPNYENSNEELPSAVGRKKPLSEPSPIYNSSPARETCPALGKEGALEDILVSPIVIFFCFRSSVRAIALSRGIWRW